MAEVTLKTVDEYKRLAGGDTSKALALMAADMKAIDEQRKAAEQRASGIANTLTIRVSGKGAVMILGLQKWPVTLYQEQWHRLLAEKDKILAFIEANKSALKVKGAA